jgi:adenylate cyclase
MAADEARTWRAFMADLKGVVEPEIAGHRGRMIKSAGDGLLVEFTSAVDAVSCAVAIQRAMLVRYAEQPDNHRIRFRIGINIGEVIRERGDIYGDGVNVAARLEALAEAGGICISGAAFEQVRDKLPFAFSDGGEQSLKHIPHPVHVYSLGASGIAALAAVPAWTRPRSLALGSRVWRLGWHWPAAFMAALAVGLVIWLAIGGSHMRPEISNTAPRLSMVVLPFSNLSSDTSQDYIADVITEELTTSLSRIPHSFVIARSTAFTYKGKAADIKQIGKDLGVRYALEGSAQLGGNRVRVNAQLVDAETGAHLWADVFDAARSDLLDMQDEIVTRLSRALQFRLVEVDVARVSRMHPENLDSEDLAMRCEMVVLNSQPGSDETEAGLKLCEQALQRDPGNVRALTNLSFKFIDRVLGVQSSEREVDIRAADELVSRALAIDPNAYPAHFAKAEVLLAQKQYEQAILEAERSLALNPSFVNAYSALSVASSFLGRPAEATDYADRAIRLSPHDPMLYVFHLLKGFAFLQLNQNEKAISWLRRAVAGAPQWPLPQALLIVALALTGGEPEAAETLKHYLALHATRARTIAQWKAQMPSQNPVFLGFAERLAQGLRKAGMPED